MKDKLKPYIQYHSNGNVWIKGQRNSKGQRVGIWEFFYPNGNIKIRTTFKNGKQDGIQEWFYENGNILRRTPYKEGREDGTQNFYDKQGRITITLLLKDGELIKTTKH